MNTWSPQGQTSHELGGVSLFMRLRLPVWLCSLSLIICLTAACSLSIQLIAPTPTPTPPPEGWEMLAPGLERRTYFPDPGNPLLQLVTLRIDPAHFTFRVHYSPGNPSGLQAWRDALPGAVAFVNGNFFDPQGNALGLVVADGVVHGQSYVGRGGMFQVANGQPRVRSLTAEPYQNEALEQAVQAFPMLVVNGASSYTNPDDTDVSRRTVVAQDSAGRIVLMVTTLFGITLSDLSAYLPTTDLGLVHALNLDGGGSTMMYIGAGQTPVILPSLDGVPVTLAVYPRGN